MLYFLLSISPEGFLLGFFVSNLALIFLHGYLIFRSLPNIPEPSWFFQIKTPNGSVTRIAGEDEGAYLNRFSENDPVGYGKYIEAELSKLRNDFKKAVARKRYLNSKKY